MKITYITLETFSEEEYVELINDLPKDLLISILKRIPKYKNNPRIKNFRDSMIDDKFVRNLFIKEYKEGKTQLTTQLLTFFDKVIKNELTQEEYALLKDNKYDDEKFELIVLKLLNESNIKSKYLKKLFNLSNTLISRYENDKKNKKVIEEFQNRENKLKNQIDELTEAIDILKKNNESLKNETKQLKETIDKNKLIDIEKMQNKSLKGEELIDILSFLKRDIDEAKYDTLLNAFNSWNLYDLEFYDLLDRLTLIKKEFLEKKNFENIKNILLIEYILIKTKEIMRND